jgi:hypothetical protein
MASAEKAYQFKGHAKFVDIARLYGWDGLGTYWRSFLEDEADNISYSTSTDALLLRLCKSVGKDIRPLFHFWGIHPDNPASLAASVTAAGLQPPVEIYDLLVHYKSLVPANNAAFQSFALSWWGKQPSINGYWEEREHARQWDTTVLYGTGQPARSETTNPGEIYNEYSAADITSRVEELLDLYYPNGRPQNGYAAWTAGPFAKPLANSGPALDFDGGGLPTGVEWVLGGDPTNSSDDAGLAPALDNTSDPEFFIFTYRRNQNAGADANTTIAVEYGSDLAGWSTATPGPDIQINVDEDGAAAGIDLVEVRIRRTPATRSSLFARLKVHVATP